MSASKWAIAKAFFGVQNFTDRARLVAHQQACLQHLLTNHRSRFYPHSLDLSDYPIINKAIFMANFDSINAYGITQQQALNIALKAEQSRDFTPTFQAANGEKITVGLSSGTSGSRGIFLVSERETARWAGYMLRRMLPRPYLSRHSIAFFLRANSNLYTAVRSRLIRFEFYDLLQNLDLHINQLNQQNPSILIAPAQVLQQLAQRDDVRIAPKKIISVAEVLEEQVKQQLQQRFGVTIHQIYQCTEGFLAHTCEHGNLHLNEDMVLFEHDWLDETRFAPIITDFNRTSQTMIRYRLDDVLQINHQPCPCGSAFTRIEAIEGRCDDILQAIDLNGKTVPLYADFVRRAMISGSLIQDYRVEQHGNTLHIMLTPNITNAQNEALAALKQMYATLNIQPFQHLFRQPEQQPLHQKLRRIVRKS